MMKVCDTTVLLRAEVDAWRQAGLRVAFVPTMGNLHAGHLSLVEQAKAVSDRVVVSIFVNPLQFGPDEDYDCYPRTINADTLALSELGVDVLFLPPVAEIYPRGYQGATTVDVPEVSEGLCGECRPGHFIGVATVVAKLFNLVQPDVVVFGQKDYQQLAVIRRMVADLCFPIEIVGGETVREKDGLALSSRNAYLTEAQRRQAPALIQALRGGAQALIEGIVDYAALEQEMMAKLQKQGFKPEYVAVRDADTLKAPQPSSALIILVAAYLGSTRLIDNLLVTRV